MWKKTRSCGTFFQQPQTFYLQISEWHIMVVSFCHQSQNVIQKPVPLFHPLIQSLTHSEKTRTGSQKWKRSTNKCRAKHQIIIPLSSSEHWCNLKVKDFLYNLILMVALLNSLHEENNKITPLRMILSNGPCSYWETSRRSVNVFWSVFLVSNA